jgi:hypothetical protein
MNEINMSEFDDSFYKTKRPLVQMIQELTVRRA